MQLFQQLGEALERLSSGQCAWNDLTKAEIRNLAEFNEEPKSAIEGLEGLALEYTWQELHQATDGFSTARQLGSGASGTVYHATLCEGTEAAVKVLDAPLRGGFEDEVRLLSRCRHPNVVMLLGFAEESLCSVFRHRRCALVYELLHGGDLYRRLQASKAYLWHERLRTATEVCRGLAHLHKHRPKIFHRDIKSQNILFSSDGTAKIADFGLACMAADNDVHEMATSQVAGTVGYSDPLYTRTGVMSESSECYSFGQVLIEILVGRPPAVLAQDGHSCVFLSDELRPREEPSAPSCISTEIPGFAFMRMLTAVQHSSRPQICSETLLLRHLRKKQIRRVATYEGMAMDVLFPQDSVGRDPTEQPEICHHAVPLVRAHGILEPGREDSTAACLGSPENALRQPELPQLESAEVLGHFLQHAQHAQQLSPAPAQILSPSPNYAHAKQASLHHAQLQVQHRQSPVPVQHQQTQALSPGAVMQLSPTAVQVAACPRPINRRLLLWSEIDSLQVLVAFLEGRVLVLIRMTMSAAIFAAACVGDTAALQVLKKLLNCGTEEARTPSLNVIAEQAAAGAGDAGQSIGLRTISQSFFERDAHGPADAKESTAASDVQKSGQVANAADARAEGDAELPRKQTSKNSANRRTRWAPEDSLRDAVIGYIGDDEEDPPQAGQAVPRQSREIQQLISDGVDVPVAKDQRSKYVWVALARGREAGSKGDLTKEAEPAQRTKKYTWNAEEIVPVDTKLARDIDLRCDLCGLDCTEVLYEFRCYPRMRAKEPRPAGGRRLHPFVSYISKECGKGLLGLQTEASKLRESIYRLVSDDNNATVETLQELWRHATKSQKLVRQPDAAVSPVWTAEDLAEADFDWTIIDGKAIDGFIPAHPGGRLIWSAVGQDQGVNLCAFCQTVLHLFIDRPSIGFRSGVSWSQSPKLGSMLSTAFRLHLVAELMPKEIFTMLSTCMNGASQVAEGSLQAFAQFQLPLQVLEPPASKAKLLERCKDVASWWAEAPQGFALGYVTSRRSSQKGSPQPGLPGPFWHALAALLLSRAVAKLVLLPFAEVQHFLMPDAPGHEDFVQQQLSTTANLRFTSAAARLFDFLMFHGDSLQVEHHLWPAMSFVHLQEASRTVKATCRELGLPYTEIGYFEAFLKVWNQVRDHAAQPE
ncbi:PERK7 [Symbiodinium sp. CCMP2592]|nr:PERK7 [Symbiodinium sp. CCMP2592]